MSTILVCFSAFLFSWYFLTTKFFDQSLGVANSWSWTFEGGTPATSTERSPVVSFGAPGTYEVSLTVSNAIGSNSITKTDYIIINDIEPTADFESIVSWNTVVFNNNSTDGLSYLWDFGDGTTSIEANPVHVYSSLNQDYEVTLITGNGCDADTLTQSILTTNTNNPSGEDTSFNL